MLSFYNTLGFTREPVFGQRAEGSLKGGEWLPRQGIGSREAILAARFVLADSNLNDDDEGLFRFLADDLLAGLQPDLDSGQDIGASWLLKGAERARQRWAPTADQATPTSIAPDLYYESPETDFCEEVSSSSQADRLPNWTVYGDRPFNPVLLDVSEGEPWFKLARNNDTVELWLGERKTPSWSVFPLNWAVASYPADLVGMYCAYLLLVESEEIKEGDQGLPKPPIVALPRTGDSLSKKSLRELASTLQATAEDLDLSTRDAIDVARNTLDRGLERLKASLAKLGLDLYFEPILAEEEAALDREELHDPTRNWEGLRTLGRLGVEAHEPVIYGTGAIVLIASWLAILSMALTALSVIAKLINITSSIREELRDLLNSLSKYVALAGNIEAALNDTLAYLMMALRLISSKVQDLGGLSLLEDADLPSVAPLGLTGDDLVWLSRQLVTNPTPDALRQPGVDGGVDFNFREVWGDAVRLLTVFDTPPLGAKLIFQLDGTNPDDLTPVFYIDWSSEQDLFAELGRPSEGFANDFLGDYLELPNWQAVDIASWAEATGPTLQLSEGLGRASQLLAAGLCADSLFFALGDVLAAKGPLPKILRSEFGASFGWEDLDQVLDGYPLSCVFAGVWKHLVAEAFLGVTTGVVGPPSSYASTFDEDVRDLAEELRELLDSGEEELTTGQQAILEQLESVLDAAGRIGGREGIELAEEEEVSDPAACLRELFPWMVDKRDRNHALSEIAYPRAPFASPGELPEKAWSRWSVFDAVLGPLKSEVDWDALDWKQPAWRNWNAGLLAQLRSREGWDSFSPSQQQTFHRFLKYICEESSTLDALEDLRYRNEFMGSEPDLDALETPELGLELTPDVQLFEPELGISMQDLVGPGWADPGAWVQDIHDLVEWQGPGPFMPPPTWLLDGPAPEIKLRIELELAPLVQQIALGQWVRGFN